MLGLDDNGWSIRVIERVPMTANISCDGRTVWASLGTDMHGLVLVEAASFVSLLFEVDDDDGGAVDAYCEMGIKWTAASGRDEGSEEVVAGVCRRATWVCENMARRVAHDQAGSVSSAS